MTYYEMPEDLVEKLNKDILFNKSVAYASLDGLSYIQMLQQALLIQIEDNERLRAHIINNFSEQTNFLEIKNGKS